MQRSPAGRRLRRRNNQKIKDRIIDALLLLLMAFVTAIVMLAPWLMDESELLGR